MTKPEPVASSGFVLIGAGLPRTGTMTSQVALKTLLNGPCYHMKSVAKAGPEDHKHWRRAVKEKIPKEEWVEFIEKRGLRAGVDYPVSMFYKDIMKAYPDAKVLLTVRDPKKWYESVKTTLYQGHVMQQYWIPYLFFCVTGMKTFMDTANTVAGNPPEGFKHSMFTAVAAGEDAAVEFFNTWVEKVKKTVPKEKLLVYEVKEGWEPLAEFLGVPVPDTVFPHVNESASMKANIDKLWWSSHLMFAGVTLAVGLVAVLCSSYFG